MTTKVAIKEAADQQRDDLFLEVIDKLYHYEGKALLSLAESAGVHYTTLYNWKTVTFSPRLNTLVRVGAALGMRLIWLKAKPAKLLSIKGGKK